MRVDIVIEQPNRCPTHPGALLSEEVLPALDSSVADAARKLRVSRQTLHRVLSGKMAVTPEMAVRLGKFCGNGPGLWLRMQAAYDLWHAERRMKGELRRIPRAAGTGSGAAWPYSPDVWTRAGPSAAKSGPRCLRATTPL